MAKEKKDQAEKSADKAAKGGEKAAKAGSEKGGAEKGAEKKAGAPGKGGKADKKGKGDGGKAERKGRDGEDAPARPAVELPAIPRLLQRYRGEVVGKLAEQFGYKSPMQAPRIVRVVVNMGLGDAVQNPKTIDHALDELRTITGQQPVATRARKSIATYKLRAGMRIGAMVTLRGERMWEFLDRLMNIALPRVRDFRGVSAKAFDGRGNYTLGVREEIIFPEIDYDKLDKIKGLNISIVTTSKTDEETFALLKHLGMPFQQRG